MKRDAEKTSMKDDSEVDDNFHDAVDRHEVSTKPFPRVSPLPMAPPKFKKFGEIFS